MKYTCSKCQRLTSSPVLGTNSGNLICLTCLSKKEPVKECADCQWVSETLARCEWHLVNLPLPIAKLFPSMQVQYEAESCRQFKIRE